MTLTPRELDVMVSLAVTGDDYAGVAGLLKIKRQTVKNHAASARKKYGVKTNTALYARFGWLKVTDYPAKY